MQKMQRNLATQWERQSDLFVSTSAFLERRDRFLQGPIQRHQIQTNQFVVQLSQEKDLNNHQWN